MPWCPSCQSEYREGIEMCPSCNVELSATPPEPLEEIDDTALLDSDKELTVLGRADFSTCLEMRAALREKAIPCVLVREAEDQTPGGRGHREVPVDLLVEVDRVEEALRILQARWHGLLDQEGLSPAGSASADPETLHCPACGFKLREDAAECPDCGLALGE